MKFFFVLRRSTEALMPPSHPPFTPFLPQQLQSYKNAKWQNTHHNAIFHRQREKKNMMKKEKRRKRKKEENKVITIIIICYISYDAPLNSEAEKRNHDGRNETKEKSIKYVFEDKKSLRCRRATREKSDDEIVCLFSG